MKRPGLTFSHVGIYVHELARMDDRTPRAIAWNSTWICRAGDVVEIEIDRVGVLRNRIVAED